MYAPEDKKKQYPILMMWWYSQNWYGHLTLLCLMFLITISFDGFKKNPERLLHFSISFETSYDWVSSSCWPARPC